MEGERGEREAREGGGERKGERKAGRTACQQGAE